MSAGYVYLIAGVVLLAAGIVSLILGKTIGLYGVVETRASIFYWIIVVVYIGLGGLCLLGALRLLLR